MRIKTVNKKEDTPVKAIFFNIKYIVAYVSEIKKYRIIKFITCYFRNAIG